ncbi:MAG: 1-(5-phosphoribosyl)-5-[(5-phosphoribosylamino)methylideneamino]imidazole-4-carboxamide isomerase [Eubacteriales bacterium]|nr:1-(5-phosphoribosyl)-5-[(5-phosphoribosylamino)methylideneamino]imidazole-4-carboxamide isomerase [Eubacteriales bacterium]
MIIYPAIDIKDGKCVRLIQGSFERQTVYSYDVVETAQKWLNMGAEYIHVVDLDGARSGEQTNLHLVKNIIAAVGIPVQTGGGIRTAETAGKVLNSGVSRVIFGTAAVNNPEEVEKAVSLYGDRIAVGIDAKDGMASVDGWESVSSTNAAELAKRMESIGVRTIIYTDISRDGMLTGPNLAAMEKMKKSVGIEVIASGGVKCIKDVVALKEAGMDGVIIGKALYTGDVDLREVIKAVRQG